jgi:hypothetical protein
MTIRKSLLLGAAVLVGTVLAAAAQPQYQPPSPNPPIPQSWSYDPYTSGLGPCPQRYPTEPPCSWTLSPTYGQPSYWPPR